MEIIENKNFKEKEELKEVHKGKKPQETVEHFLQMPNLRPVFGLTVTKDTDIDDVTETGEVHQTIKNLVFTTEINRKRDMNGLDITEDSKLVVKLKEGTRLIWSEYSGYTLVPAGTMATREEIKKELKNLDGIEGLK